MPRRIRVANFFAWFLIFGGVVGAGVVMIGAAMVDDFSTLTMIRAFILEACCFGLVVVGKMLVDMVSDWHMANLRAAVLKHGPALFKR